MNKSYLNTLDFCDLIITATIKPVLNEFGTPIDSRPKGFLTNLKNSEINPTPVPPDGVEEVYTLFDGCANKYAADNKSEFVINYGGRIFRVSVIKTIKENLYILRRMPIKVPELSMLNFNDKIGVFNFLLKKDLTGLVIISGTFGQGKTTTAAALIRERLINNGGIAYTIEDPPEMPLQGMHGNGVCFQQERDSNDFGIAIKELARFAPDIIFLGEIRDVFAAQEALIAANNGRLIICTMHARDVLTTIQRFIALSSGYERKHDEFAKMLAQGFRGIVHQKLEGIKDQKPVMDFLIVETETERNALETAIRNEDYGFIKTFQMQFKLRHESEMKKIA